MIRLCSKMSVILVERNPEDEQRQAFRRDHWQIQKVKIERVMHTSPSLVSGHISVLQK